MNISRYLDINSYSRRNQYIFVLITGLFTAFLLFIPYIVQDKGYFLYMGDYNVQQIPFYISSHEAVRSGNIFWSWETDLGANFIGSYSFYLLGSPFFLFTLLFPTGAVAYLMPWLLILKFGLSALTGYAFISRYVKNKTYALLSALMYAFSGFAVFNIFFNHFNEVLVTFPLLLIAIDKTVQDNKKGWFAAAVFLSALYNYYFFVAEVVFLTVYLLLRVLYDTKRQFTIKKVMLLGVEAVIGFFAAAFIVFPAVLTTLQIGRAGTKLDGWALVHYYEVQRYFQIVQAFFLPPELPSQPNFYPDSGGKWASVAAWLPLFGMSGVIAWFSRKKNKGWQAIIVGVLIFVAFQPALNASFQLLSDSFYTRWFFMLILMLALVTAMALEKCSEREWKFGLLVTAAITAFIALPVALITDPKSGKLSLAPYPDRMWMYIIITAASIVLTGMLILSLKRNTSVFPKMALITLLAVILTYSHVVISQGKTLDNHESNEYIRRYVEGRQNFNLGDDGVYRVDIRNSEDNSGLFWGVSSIQTFHSVVPGSIFDFYRSIGISRDVSSKPDMTHTALRPLLSVKYLINGDRNEVIPGYTYLKDVNGYSVHTNDSYIPYGFCYDKYMVRSEWDLLPTEMREQELLDVLVIEDGDEAMAEKIMERKYSEDAVKADIATLARQRNKTVTENFTRDNRGFSCNITPDKDTYVFFSIPYEPGWSARVNGEKVPVIKAGVGFMAVNVQGGMVNDICFDYMTPGLLPGLAVSGFSLLVFILYALLGREGKKGARLKLLSLAGENGRVAEVRGITYGLKDGENTSGTMNFYTLPCLKKSPPALIIVVPELGEDGNSDIDYTYLAWCLALCGVAVFNVKYTPYCGEDESSTLREGEQIKSALEFIRSYDEKYGIEATNISLSAYGPALSPCRYVAYGGDNMYQIHRFICIGDGDLDEASTEKMSLANPSELFISRDEIYKDCPAAAEKIADFLKTDNDA